MNGFECKERKRTLQAKVIVGKGKQQFFVEKDIFISPPSPPVFEIVAVDVNIDVYDMKLITGGDCKCGWAKVIFNAWVCKNIIYKTLEHVHDGTVNGPLFHSTLKIPVGGFVEVHPVKGERIKEGDIAELISAKFEGAKEELHDEIRLCKDIKLFKKLLEKAVFEVEFKVVRVEHVCVKDAGEDMEEPCTVE